MTVSELTEVISPAASQCDFNMFGAAHNKAPQNSVEIIQGCNPIKGGPVTESRADMAFWVLKIEPVRA